jgi:maltooligosyltrehalose trehalohydrolase
VVLESGAAAGAHPLAREEGGVHAGVVEGAGAADLYRLRLPDGSLVPDPASRDQPKGVHGPSRVVDPSLFSWSDAEWGGISGEGLVIYELHVGTFTPEGTFEAAARRLPELAELGVTAI